MSTEVRPMEERDRERVVAIHAQAFQVPEYRLIRQRTLPLERGWVVTQHGRVVGGLRVDTLGQFFGGRSVSSAIITAVKIAAEAKGKGLGRALTTEVVRALAARGIALSTLYPSSPALYRRVGYGTAGMHVRYRLPITRLGQSRTGQLEEWGTEVPDEVRRCYRRFAGRHSGLVDRDDTWWQEWIVDPYLDRPTYRYLVRGDEGVAGYLVFGQSPDPRGDLPYVSTVSCTDFVWLDPAAARAGLGFLGAQGPLISSASWPGPVVDPLVSLLDTPPLVASSFHWMTRLLDVPAALAARGYSADVDDRISVRVVDETMAANAGTFQLEVRNGRAAVSRGEGPVDCTIDVGGLAPLYTGWLGAADLARLGRLEANDPRVLQRLDAIFAGPVPWLVELV
ncbi:MAG: enhanced intracellular survival protein Eis [Gemmatimonadales bacterium]